MAYQNGGGAFLIPYIIVLIVIGKPMYYLETVLGQFSNSNCVNVWGLSPAMKGQDAYLYLRIYLIIMLYQTISAYCFFACNNNQQFLSLTKFIKKQSNVQ